MKRRVVVVGLIILMGAINGRVSAAEPSLQLSPLEYQDTLGASVKIGSIDVSNPGDAQIELSTTIQGFRQIDNSGHLQFYDDPVLSNGIRVSVSDFTLGARQAARIEFSIDPIRLPQGGVNAAIFFQTVPAAAPSRGSVVTQSLRLGTLLVLNNGGVPLRGSMGEAHLPFWQVGAGVAGSLSYTNTGGQSGAAFNPTIGLSVRPGGAVNFLSGPLILPGHSRSVSLTKSGSYLGPVRIILRDPRTRQEMDAWAIAITGYWRWLLPLILGLIGPFLVWMVTRKRLT